MVLILPYMDRPRDADVKDLIVRELSSGFKFPIHHRIDVRSDMNQFNYKEDQGVWLQGKKKRPHYFELYWDNVWICDFTDTEAREVTVLKFWKGFKNAYEAGTVTLNKKTELEKAINDQIVEDAVSSLNKKIKDIESKRAATIEDSLSNEVISGILKKKKERIKTKRAYEKIKMGGI